MGWFSGIRGNARGCVVYEPMFVFPYNLFMTYATVYMLRLGMGPAQIGLVTSLSLILQLFSSAISGHVTDRLGRKRALLFFDLLSWAVGTLIWALAQNVWFFVGAALVNSFQKIPNTAWYCILVEDTEPADRSTVFTALQFINVAAGLAAPLGGLLIDRLTLIPAVRLLYGAACLSMTAMFFLRNRAVHETDIGRRKMRETEGVGMLAGLRENAGVIREILGEGPVVAVFAVYILNNFQSAVATTFVSIYEVSALGIPPAWIALFPSVASAATLIVMYVVVPRLRPEHGTRHVTIGFAVSIAANLLLMLAPVRDIPFVALTAILSAIGTVIAMPFLEALTANSIRDEERAKFLSVLTVFILLFTWPAGVIGGWAYGIQPRLTFVVVVACFAAGLAVLYAVRRMQRTAAVRDTSLHSHY